MRSICPALCRLLPAGQPLPTTHEQEQWQRFLQTCVPVCATDEQEISEAALYNQLHIEAGGADSAAAKDKINSRTSAHCRRL